MSEHQQMGGYYSREETWYIYTRDLTTDAWNKNPLHQEQTKCMGHFKHLVYKFALQKTGDDKSYKALYLYTGSKRIAKAELHRPEHDNYYKMELEFNDADEASEWDLAEEQILSQTLLWRETDFNKYYVSLPEEVKFKRRWQLVKTLDSPHLPRLSLSEYIKHSEPFSSNV